MQVYQISQPETSRVLWSWHTEDPLGPDRIGEHEFKGSSSLNLLTGGIKKRKDPPNAQNYTIRVENVSFDREYMQYKCTYTLNTICHNLQLLHLSFTFPINY